MGLQTLDIDEIKRKVVALEKNKHGKLKGTTVRAIKIYNILKKDDFKCVKCGKETELTIDHINGRKFAKHNNHQKYKEDACQTLCKECHQKKNETQKK